MKKLLVIIIALLPSLLFSQNTQLAENDAQSIQLILKNHLVQMGCPIIIEEEELILFKYQGAGVALVTQNNDPNYFQLVYPFIYEVQNNRKMVLETINTIMSETKTLKAHIDNKNNVCLSIEMFTDITPHIADILERCLGILIEGRQDFYTGMTQYE